MKETIRKEETLRKIIKYLKSEEIISTGIDSLNILYLLKIHYNEVVTCRLIKLIIDPDGIHGLGTIPIKLFLESVLSVDTSSISLSNIRIELEEKITDKRRVDIAIYADKKVYPIEVKIWAKDQKNQLYDYYEYYRKKEDITIDKIYYLTPNGHRPSEESKKGLGGNDIECVSFGREILNYLKKLKTYYNETTSFEYKTLVDNFTEVIKLMSSTENNNEIFVKMFNEGLTDKKDKSNILAFLNQKDSLWESIRNDYLESSIKEYSRINNSPIEVSKDIPQDFVDSKCIFVLTYDNKKAYLCIDENVYLARSKNSFDERTFVGEWAKEERRYENTEYVWHYIYKKGSDKAWDLKHIDEQLFDATIEWDKYL